ncbi:hypothetical protein [Sphingobacterium sp.]|uniref:DUF6908 domain-containing protein n=1 Tax=Sphingobacterium sp. TaxID=341027 RepID=UPI0031D9B333
MEFLNKEATIIFCELLNRLQTGSIKIYNNPYAPLSMKLVGVGIQTRWDVTNVYSLRHDYEHNEIMIQLPEICFLVTDNWKRFADDLDKMKIAPFMYQQVNLGIYHNSIKFKNSKLSSYLPKRQKQQTELATTWLQNIREQGFLIS